MNNKFDKSNNIGDVVTKFPGAGYIFMENKIDFCCGGNRKLEEVIKEQGLDEETILNQLNSKYEKYILIKEDNDFTKYSSKDLIEYVVNKHHGFLKNNLPKIEELILKILKAHSENHGDLLKQVYIDFNSLKMELDIHLIKEETKVFPAIISYEEGKDKDLEKLKNLINELEDEHTGAGDIIKNLRKITDDYSVPEDGCNTFILTYKMLEELEKDLFQHIHLENNILFKRY
ncbi:MAG: iron-sulfur cluster repair di-iron protein [Clostridiaceae bacterium]